MHASDNYSQITRRVDLIRRYSELGTLILKVIAEGIVDAKHLTLGVTFGLNGKLDKVFIGWDTCSAREAWSHSSIQASTRYSCRISACHFGFHTSDLIEAI